MLRDFRADDHGPITLHVYEKAVYNVGFSADVLSLLLSHWTTNGFRSVVRDCWLLRSIITSWVTLLSISQDSICSGHSWSVLNRFCSLYANLHWHKWGLATSELCDLALNRPWIMLSTSAQVTANSTAVRWGVTKLTMTQSTGWKRWRQKNSRNEHWKRLIVCYNTSRLSRKYAIGMTS